MVASDVEHASGGFVAEGQVEDTLHDFGDMCETTHLGSIVIDDNRTTSQSGFNEAGDNHAIVADLTGANDVEKASDGHTKTVFLVVAQCEELVDGFGAAVGPAWAAGWAEVQIVFLSPAFPGIFAVNFTG